MGMGTYVGPEGIEPRNYKPQVTGDRSKIEAAVDMLVSAKRPIIYAGGGVINSGPKASQLLQKLVKMTGYPCTTTLMALGAYPTTDIQFVGMPGMHGTVPAVLALQEADLLITLGARFDDRVTGKAALFAPHAKVIHVDIDPAEISKIRTADVPIVGDLKDVLLDLPPSKPLSGRSGLKQSQRKPQTPAPQRTPRPRQARKRPS